MALIVLNQSLVGNVKLVNVADVDTDPNIRQFIVTFRGHQSYDRLAEGRYGATGWKGEGYFEVYIKPAGIDRKDREYYEALFALTANAGYVDTMLLSRASVEAMEVVAAAS